jgi:hypothetical protein
MEIKEAIKILKSFGNEISDPIQTLIVLAEKVIAAEEGFPSIEELSELVHKAYCKSYQIKHGKDYWTGGDYNKLTEEDKNYDRATVKVVIDACAIAVAKNYVRRDSFPTEKEIENYIKLNWRKPSGKGLK